MSGTKQALDSACNPFRGLLRRKVTNVRYDVERCRRCRGAYLFQGDARNGGVAVADGDGYGNRQRTEKSRRLRNLPRLERREMSKQLPPVTWFLPRAEVLLNRGPSSKRIAEPPRELGAEPRSQDRKRENAHHWKERAQNCERTGEYHIASQWVQERQMRNATRAPGRNNCGNASAKMVTHDGTPTHLKFVEQLYNPCSMAAYREVGHVRGF